MPSSVTHNYFSVDVYNKLNCRIKKLIKPAKTTLIGRISLGKYTFFIIPPLIHTQLHPDVTTVVKNTHGITPVIRNTK